MTPIMLCSMTTEAAPVAFSCRFHAPVDRNWMWTITAREYHRQSIIGAIRRATSNGGGFQDTMVMRQMGWLISVQSPDAAYRQLYATVAYTHEHARLQVFNHCSITNETVRLERILTDGEIKLIGLQPGEVKLFGID
jgi:hypothetical protein